MFIYECDNYCHHYTYIHSYVNHNLYWSVMSPNQQNLTRTPEGSLLSLIKRDFESFSKFKEAFSTQANVLFGSGRYCSVF